jgi:hypothetical protein
MPTRKRRQGGGGGNSYSFGPAVSSAAPYASSVIGSSSCMAAARPGMISGYTPPGLGGLPGMAGGRRRGRKTRNKRRRRSQRGGRYTTVPGAPYAGSTGPNTFMPIAKLGCNYRGGGSRKRMYKHKGGGADTVAYYAPTAGYGNQPSSWTASTGAPVLIQTPYNAGSMNQACLKTGGGRRRRKSSRKH